MQRPRQSLDQGPTQGPTQPPMRKSYRALFRVPGFRPLFGAVVGQVGGQTVQGLALATLVYGATSSPLLAALAMFGASFGQLLGGLTLLSTADRLPPRAALAGLPALLGLLTLVLAAPGLPVAALLAVVGAQGLIGSVLGGVRWGLLDELLPPGGYVLGRSVLNASTGAMQIAGFAVGGALVALVSARGALLVAAGLYGTAAVVALGLGRRPPRAVGRPSVRATWSVNRRLWSRPAVRRLYAAVWVPNGLVVGCEALFVPYAPGWAAALLVAGALGMVAGDVLAGRLLPAAWRGRCGTPLLLLLATPFLLFAVEPPGPVAVAAAAVASVGFGATLLFQERLLRLVPEASRGQALGLHSSGMLAMQAVAATLAGALAQWLPVGVAMAAMAGASLTVTLALARPLARDARRPPAAEPAAEPGPEPAPGAAGERRAAR